LRIGGSEGPWGQNEAATIIRQRLYDVYGATPSSTGSQPNPYQFAGQATDSTGLQYLRARYYDPATGTFLSSDPMGASPAWTGNPYGYANGNPALLVDPYGLFGLPNWSDVKDAAASVGGFVVTQGRKYLPEGDALTNLSELQTVLGAVAAGSCVSGILPVCIGASAGYFLSTVAKTAVLHDRINSGEMSGPAGECQYLTEGPLPFPLSSIGSVVCSAIGSLSSPASSSKTQGEKQLWF
jgi:RHS repeat-associated protein